MEATQLSIIGIVGTSHHFFSALVHGHLSVEITAVVLAHHSALGPYPRPHMAWHTQIMVPQREPTLLWRVGSGLRGAHVGMAAATNVFERSLDVSLTRI